MYVCLSVCQSAILYICLAVYMSASHLIFFFQPLPAVCLSAMCLSPLIPWPYISFLSLSFCYLLECPHLSLSIYKFGQYNKIMVCWTAVALTLDQHSGIIYPWYHSLGPNLMPWLLLDRLSKTWPSLCQASLCQAIFSERQTTIIN